MKYVISAVAILLANGGVFALPQGGRIESGKGNLDNPAHIIQESQHLQTRWNSFDIAAEEQVRIQQPNAQASINIKVSAGGAATTINGTLTANGRVSLENPAGIQFGENSVVNVGGLLASSAKGAVTSLGQVRAAEVVRFQGLSSKSIVNVGGNVSAQEIIVESNGDIVIGNSAHFTASKQVLIGGGYQGKDSSVLNSQTTDVKAAAQINAPRVIVWSDKETSFLGRINAGRGFVEVSGKQNLIFPDISRATAGTLLLDPANIIIQDTFSSGSTPITDDGILRADEFAGITYIIAVSDIVSYNGNVSLAATNIITVDPNADITKSNGSLTLSGNRFTINSIITITGAGNYLSFVLTGGVPSFDSFYFGSGSINTDDVRLAINYTTAPLFYVFSNFAAPGRNVTITTPPGDRGIAFNNGFNLCQADNTGCGDLIIDVGKVLFLNGTSNTIRAKSINITVGATQGIISNNGPLDLHAHEGDVSITATGGGSIYSNSNQNFNFSASHNVNLKDVGVEIGSGTMTLTAGVGALSTGTITLAGSSFTTLSALLLSQDQFFPAMQPFLSSSAPVTATYRGSITPHLPLTWATLVYQGVTPSDLNVSDGNLSAALVGKFDVSSGELDLGSFNLTAMTTPLDIPSGILTITTTGTISIASGLTASATLLITLTADTMVLGGTMAVVVLGSQLFLNSPNPIMASSDLRIEAVVFVDAPSLGSAGFDLWTSTFLAFGAFELLGNDITINSNGTTDLNPLTITANNDIILEGLVQAGTLVLEAKTGSIIFSNTTITQASRIEITQADPYAATVSANFSATPILNGYTPFIRPSWGICGTNCFDPAAAGDLLIIDGDLATALVGKFDASSGTLDLGSSNLTANTVALDIPSHIHTIMTTGTINIASGLTATVALSLTADTMAFGGTFTAGTNTLILGSTNPIMANRALTISSPLALFVPSLGSAGFDLTLAAVISSGALTLLGSNITLNGEVATPTNFALTVTADNDLAVNDAITVGALALTAAAGGITFASPSTVVMASTIMLTQADPYVARAPTTFSTTPILNSPTRFNRPSWGLCGTNCFDPMDLVITDGDLAAALVDKFYLSGSTLDLGSFNLTANTVALDIPSHIRSITTTGMISITDGFTATAGAGAGLNLTASTMAFGGTLTTDTNILTLTSTNPITASSALTVSSPLALSAPSLGSAGFDLTLAGISITSAVDLLGENITLGGVVTVNSSALAITADNDIAVNDAITVGALALTATAGGITFASTSTAITASSIDLTQAEPYVVPAPATFSTTPVLNSATSFIRPFWGSCGINCSDPVPTDLVITDGNLATALIGKFDASSGTVDLGSFNLTANTLALVIPSHIHTITTTGTISIASGSTASAALQFTAGTMVLGGTFTTVTNTLTLTSTNPIMASSALTVSSPLALSAPSLGSVGANLTLVGVTSLSALELLGSNITLNGAVDADGSALTVTADNDLIVNDTIMVGTLALIATAGGITFASTSTAITASSINLTQAAAYAAIAPTTFSTTPILNSPTRFNRPSWGLCGTNCLDPTDLVITNGNLTTALVGRFDTSSGRLDLGSLNLVANTTALDIPSHITTITTTGMISITDGLTATVGLNLTAGTFVFGGTLTTDTNTLTLTSANPITARSALTINSPLALSAPSLGSVSFDLTLAAVTSSSALELRGSNIMLGGAVTAPRIALTQAAAYAAIAPTTFSTVPTLNSPNRFNRPSWGLCGTNCLDPTDLAITDGDLTTALVDKFDVLGGTLDLGSFNLTANTTALDIPSHITAITTTGMISITDGLTATAALQFTADMMAFGGTLTTNTLTLTSANPITASSALTVSSPLALSAASLGSVSFDLTLAAVTSLSALELRGSNITLNGAVAAPRIALTQAAAYAAIAPTTFSTTPILNSPTRFNRPSWGLCGTNCLDPTDLVITDGDLTTALVDKFDLSGSTLDLGSFNLVANTVALDIPSHILSITTTGMISITDGLTATAAAGGAGLNLTAGTMAFGGTLTTNTLTLNSANPITARSALTINSPLALSAPSLGSASFDLTLAAVTSLSALELLGSNITLNGAVTAPRIELTQAAAYAAIAPTTFSTTPILNSPTRFNRPSWGLCGTNCFDPTDLVITDGDLTTALVDKFYLSSGTLDLGSFNLTANTVALDIPSHILSITTTGTISIASGLTAMAAAGASLTAGTMTLGGTLTTNTLTLNSANPITASSALTVSSPLTLSAPSLGSVGFDLTLAAVASSSALELLGNNITLNGAVTAPTIELTQAAAYAAIAPTTFSTIPTLNRPTPFIRPSWGLCGTNCFDPTDLVITDGDLTAALVGRFNVSGNTLDLGSLNLTANTTALDIPSHITTITTTGMISITSGLTAGAGLNLTAGTIGLGGILTTGTDTLTLNSANPIAASSALTVSSPLTLSAPSLGSASFDLTLAGVTSSSALELRGSNITLGGAVTAPRIELTQAATYAAIAPTTFSTVPILNSPNRFNRPSWGLCGTNCLDPTDLAITDGDLTTALVDKFDVLGGTLDLGSFNLTANTVALDIPSHILTITTTGTISITSGLTATAAAAGAGLTLTADTMAFGGTLTTNTLTLNSANPITASSALTVSSPLALSAASLGSVSFDLTLAAVTSPSALELLGNNITLGGAVTAPTIELTQAAAYAAIAPTTFSTVPTLNRPTPFIRPSWGVCGTNCFEPTDLVITDGDLTTALVGRFSVLGNTLDLGSLNLVANTTALDIPSHITTITTTGTISITSGLTATAAAGGAGLNLTADTIGLGGILTTGTNTLTLNSANPITASSALTINSPLILSAASLGSAGVDLTLAGVTSSSMIQLLGKNITLGGVVTASSSATVTAANDLAVNNTITAATLALEATAGGITFATTSTAVTGSTIELTQADSYVAIAPATFSTPPTLNRPTIFSRPSWGVCGTNCFGPGDLVVTDGALAAALVGRFNVSGNTLDLGSFSLVATTTALVIPSGILTITTTGTISITSGLTATAGAGLNLTAGTMAFGGTLTTNTLTLTSANAITASSALTVSSPLVLSAASLGSASFDLTLAAVTSSSALELRGANITLGGVVTASSSATVTADNDLVVNDTIMVGTLTLIAVAGGITFASTSTAVAGSTIELTQADPYVAIAPATFSTPPTLNSPNRFNRPSWGLCGTNCVDPENMLTSASAIQLLGANITLGSAATNSFALTLPAADDIAVNSANGWRPCSRDTSGQNYFCYH